MAYRLSSVQYNVTLGQTRFSIYERALGRISLAVNGQGQLPNTDFTVTGGATAEWISSDFSLDPGDVVEIQYLTQD